MGLEARRIGGVQMNTGRQQSEQTCQESQCGAQPAAPGPGRLRSLRLASPGNIKALPQIHGGLVD